MARTKSIKPKAVEAAPTPAPAKGQKGNILSIRGTVEWRGYGLSGSPARERVDTDGAALTLAVAELAQRDEDSRPRPRGSNPNPRGEACPISRRFPRSFSGRRRQSSSPVGSERAAFELKCMRIDVERNGWIDPFSRPAAITRSPSGEALLDPTAGCFSWNGSRADSGSI